MHLSHASKNLSILRNALRHFKSKPKPGAAESAGEELLEAARVTWPSADRAFEAEKKQRGTPDNSPVGAVNAAEEVMGTNEIKPDDSVTDAAKKIAGRVAAKVMGKSTLDVQAESARQSMQEAQDRGAIKGRDVMPKGEGHQ